MARSAPPQLTDAEYGQFRELLDERLGVDFPATRRRDLERAVTEALRITGLHTVEELYLRLVDRVRGGDVLEAMIPMLTIGETHFFRNRAQMEALERQILPGLIERRRSLRRLRVWSAGCASGEEPYSIAMLLDRLLPDSAEWDLTILGTDLNVKALEKARAGVYGSWSFREVPGDVKSNYFSAQDDRLHVDPRIREMVTFARLNLVEDSFPSPVNHTAHMDLILCRNVLIYFRPETIRRVVERLHQALVPGGWLVVGHVEPSQGVFGAFHVHHQPGTITYQKHDLTTGIPEPGSRLPTMAPRPRATTGPRRRRAPVAVTTSSLRERGGPASAPERASSLYDEGMELLAVGQAGDALRVLQAAAAIDGRAAYQVAKICAGRQQLEAARHWVELAVSADQTSAAGHYLKGVILQELGDLDGALATLRRCVYVDPGFVLGHFSLSGVHAQLGEHARARKALEHAARLIEGRDRDELVPEGDRLTFGRLLQIVDLKRNLSAG